MATRSAVVAAIAATLDTINDTVQETGGQHLADRLAARLAALETTYPNHLTDPTQAAAYQLDAQKQLGSAVAEIFENSTWRTAYLGALADGILLGDAGRSYNLGDYCVGDGTTDDLAAAQAVIDSMVDGDELYIPRQRFRLVGTLLITGKSIKIRGSGIGSCLFPDGGTGVDGIYISNNIRYLHCENFSILGNNNVRDCLHLSYVVGAYFRNVHVKGAHRYDTYIQATLSSYFNLISSGNYAYPYPSGPSPMVSTGLVRVGPGVDWGFGPIQTNANVFDLVLEGGAFTNGSTAQFYQENQGGEGDNWVRGTFENATSGRAIEVYGSSVFHLTDAHVEISGDVLIDGTRGVTIGPGANLIGDLSFNNCLNVKVDGVECKNLTVDPSCAIVQLGAVFFNNGGQVVDPGYRCLQLGALQTAQSAIQNNVAQVPSQIVNYVWNGGVERYGANSLPDGFSTLGTGPGGTKTGLGLGDTTRNLSSYACKMTSGGAGDGLSWRLYLDGRTPGVDILQGTWLTATVWAKVQGVAGSTVQLRADMDGGTTVAQVTSSSSSFAKLQICFFCGSHTSLDLSLAMNQAGAVIYHTDWSIVAGFGSPMTNSPSNLRRERPFMLLGSVKVHSTTGNPQSVNTDWANVGDWAVEANPTQYGNGIYQCFVSGAPGTQKWAAHHLSDRSAGGILSVSADTFSDANYAIPSPTTALAIQYLTQNATLTATRTVTLPPVSTYPLGATIVVTDESGSPNLVNKIVVAPSGGDIINGPTSIISGYSGLMFISYGASAWLALRLVGGSIVIDGDLRLTAVGNGIYVKTGTNATAGTGTLAAGAATIANTKVTANTLVMISDAGGGITANIGSLYEDKPSRVPGTSFTVKSTNVLDTSNFNWWLLEPA